MEFNSYLLETTIRLLNFDFFMKCSILIVIFFVLQVIEASPVDPCNPSPCGPNSQCREINGQAVCSCRPSYVGSPPSCRPECVVSSECPRDKACMNQKCVDPCTNTCGQNAICHVINHSPICSCRPSYTGDPFTFCSRIPRKQSFRWFLIFSFFCIIRLYRA